jgi:hypothetical protein
MSVNKIPGVELHDLHVQSLLENAKTPASTGVGVFWAQLCLVQAV